MCEVLRDRKFAAKSNGQDEILARYFSCRIAIVQVEFGETKEEAWRRHLATHPGDVNATVKVFNCLSIKVPNSEKGCP